MGNPFKSNKANELMKKIETIFEKALKAELSIFMKLSSSGGTHQGEGVSSPVDRQIEALFTGFISYQIH